MLPGWYGTGEGFAAFEDKALLADMAAGWPFFAALLGNMEMVLAKSDMGIAARYAELAADIDGHEAIFARIQGGWNLAHDGLRDLTRQTRLLERNQSVEAQIRWRVPNVEQ